MAGLGGDPPCRAVHPHHLKGPSVIKMHLNIFSKQSVLLDGVPLTRLGVLHTAWLPPVCVRSAGGPLHASAACWQT